MSIIWHHTSSPPQHIGNADPMANLEELIASATAARWRVAVALRVQRSFGPSVSTFDTVEREAEWRRRNPGLTILDRAEAPARNLA